MPPRPPFPSPPICFFSLAAHALHTPASSIDTIMGNERRTESSVDGRGTTPMRNAIDVPSLCSWMARQPALSVLLSIIPRPVDHRDSTSDADADADAHPRGGGGRRRRRRPPPLADRISVRQFGFGQSNPTYLLTMIDENEDVNVVDDHPLATTTTTATAAAERRREEGAAATAVRLVLRRRPDAIAHPTSHDLRREYRVLEGLTLHNARLSSTSSSSASNTFDGSVPVPRPYAYCQDVSVIGAEFYVMEYVGGRIFEDPRMTTMACREERARAYRDAVRVLSVRG